MQTAEDINTFQDVQLIVDEFYAKIREDELLKDIFNDIIQDRWPEHLEKMYRFWETVLLGEHSYTGKPFIPHLRMPVEKKHFQRWLQLFTETVDEHFSGKTSKLAKWQADRMAAMFQIKINYFRKNSEQTPLL